MTSMFTRFCNINEEKDCLRIDVSNEVFLVTKRKFHISNTVEKALYCFIP